MCYWVLTSDTQELIVRGTVRSAETTDRPSLALDSGEIQALEEDTSTYQNEKSTQDLDDHDQEEDKWPLVERQNTSYESQTEGYTIPKLPITIYPNELIDKYVY